MAKELPNCFYICWRRQFGNKFNFCLVNFYSPAGNNMPQCNSLVHHKMAFLPVKHQVLFNAPLQDSFKISQTFFKVIHVYFHYALHHIAKHTKHTSLKGDRCVTKTKRHPPVSISAQWASKGSLFLIFWCNLYLKVP